MTCRFCTIQDDTDNLAYLPVQLGSFIALWDSFPVTPGHALVVPKRHIQVMNSLNALEKFSLLSAIDIVKNYIREEVDFIKLYEQLLPEAPNHRSVEFMQAAIKADRRTPPDAFNDGINDGPAAGQTIPHLHWHIMPRWDGDMENPQGGIRHMFPGKGHYK